MHLLWPLLSSMLYVVAALFLKQAAQRQAGVLRSTFVCNWCSTLLFQSLWLLGGTIPDGRMLWQPAVVAMLLLAAQILTFLTLKEGDVSVATPVMSIKVVLVALFMTWILREDVSWNLWVAAGTSCTAIGLLNVNLGTTRPRHVGRTIILALQAAAGYALFDVLVIKWSPAWGVGSFLPVMFLCCGLYSSFLIPLFRKPLRSVPAAGWKPLLLGALFLSLQAMILICTLAVFGDGTAVNVVYSTRGLWSVLAVLWVGGWFGNRERDLGAHVLRWRLAGAVLMGVAVVLVFL